MRSVLKIQWNIIESLTLNFHLQLRAASIHDINWTEDFHIIVVGSFSAKINSK